MPRMSGIDQRVVEITEILAEAAPERCRPCIKPYTLAGGLARKVVSEEVAIDQAYAELGRDLEENCPLGVAGKGSCVGNELICGYGGRELTEDDLITAVQLGIDLPLPRSDT